MYVKVNIKVVIKKHTQEKVHAESLILLVYLEL